MNRDINYTLAALVPILRMNGEKVKSIEAVRHWSTDINNGEEYFSEVAEITYDNDHKGYAYIEHDSNLAAVVDVMRTIMRGGDVYISPKEKIERNVYPKEENNEV